MAAKLASFEIYPQGQPAVAASVSRDLSVPSPAEPVDDTPFSFAYTGKHDNGTLPPLSGENSYGHVLSAVATLKEQFEVSMRQLIAADMSSSTSGGAGTVVSKEGSSKSKKPRLDADVDDGAEDEAGADEDDGLS